MQIYVSTHLIPNDYIALIAFSFVIEIRTDHRAIQRYSSYVSMLSKKFPSSFDE